MKVYICGAYGARPTAVTVDFSAAVSELRATYLPHLDDPPDMTWTLKVIDDEILVWETEMDGSKVYIERYDLVPNDVDAPDSL